MQLKSLKLDTSEAKAESGIACESEAPAYPWGCSIYLDEVALAKLGMTREQFKVGATLSIQGKVRVTGTSEREREGGEKCATVDLQLTDLGIDAKAKGKTPGQSLYGDDEGGDFIGGDGGAA